MKNLGHDTLLAWGPTLSLKSHGKKQGSPLGRGKQPVIKAVTRSSIGETQKWFAPLMGVRSRSVWVGLIGVEVDPTQTIAQQKPVVQVLSWEVQDSKKSRSSDLRALFKALYGEKADNLRYPGQWIPT